MTPEEKAQDIYFSFLNAGKGMMSEHLAKQCAIICINEIIQSSDHAGGWDDYWQSVLSILKSNP